jgi:voltage-gated potassium channel
MPKQKTPSSFIAEMFLPVCLLLVVWAVGAVFYHVVEGLNYIDAIYFTACTLTTVGYGDITPQTDAGKLFTAAYTFVGIGIFLGFAAALFGSVSDRLRHNR